MGRMEGVGGYLDAIDEVGEGEGEGWVPGGGDKGGLLGEG